jgi:hypothetical protein
MTTKAFEIRDRATFIPAIAVRLDPADERERYLIARCGFGVTPSAQAPCCLRRRHEIHHLPV